MLTIIVLASVGFILGITSRYFADGITGAFIGAFLGITIAMIIGSAMDGKINETTKRVALSNLADTRTVEGSFFLGIGSIDGEAIYAWYEETADNTYEQKSVDVSSAKIHFVPKGQAPYYLKRTRHHEIDASGWYLAGGYTDSPKYDFYVPEGSITRSFNLDAQ